jgi:hypothetical protein
VNTEKIPPILALVLQTFAAGRLTFAMDLLNSVVRLQTFAIGPLNSAAGFR